MVSPRVKVKVCGITNLKDAQASIAAGCDALGFNFYKKSPRYIEPKKAREIISKLPKKIIKVGVFVNEEEETIRRITKLCRLDMLQFHGDESPAFCAGFKDFKIIKAFRIKDKIILDDLSRYKVFAYLFDSFAKLKFGGTGKSFDWKLMKPLEKLKQPIFLSGGLSLKNIKSAIGLVSPDWLDVCSSVEVIPGKKDHLSINKFIKRTKKVLT